MWLLSLLASDTRMRLFIQIWTGTFPYAQALTNQNDPSWDNLLWRRSDHMTSCGHSTQQCAHLVSGTFMEALPCSAVLNLPHIKSGHSYLTLTSFLLFSTFFISEIKLSLQLFSCFLQGRAFLLLDYYSLCVCDFFFSFFFLTLRIWSLFCILQ